MYLIDWIFFSPFWVEEGPWAFSQRLITFQMFPRICLCFWKGFRWESSWESSVFMLSGIADLAGSKSWASTVDYQRNRVVRGVRCWGLSGQDPLKHIHHHPRIPNDLWLVAWFGWSITQCKDVLDKFCLMSRCCKNMVSLLLFHIVSKHVHVFTVRMCIL